MGGFPSSDDVIEWTSGEPGRTTPATISSISVPKGQQGADAVAIKVKCDRCVPKVPGHTNNVGGYLWISFRGQEHYSPLDVNVLDPKYQEKVFVHLERAHRSRFAQRGTELWTYIGAGSSYVLPHTDQVLYVCSVGPELATVMVARTDREARNACTSDPATTTSTQKPVKRIQWKLARSRQSCTDSCREDGKVCDDMALQETNTTGDILKAGELANRTCQANPQHNFPATVRWGYDWNPAICTHRRCCGCGECRGICAFGDTGRRSCDKRSSSHHQRLCPCADRSAITM